MTFTREQLTYLSQFERNFHEVIDMRICRNIGDRTTSELAELWHSVTNTPKRTYRCAQCRANLIRQVGAAYRQDVAELAAKRKKKTTKSEE